MIILNRIAEIIIRYRDNTITPDEKKELGEWLAQRTEHFLLFLDLIDDEYLQKASRTMFEGAKNANWKKIKQKIMKTLPD